MANVYGRKIEPTVSRRAYQFFRDNAGGWIGHNAETAIALARAENFAESRGWAFDWHADEDPDLGDHSYWCRTAELNARGRSADGSIRPDYYRSSECQHDVYACLLWDADGITVLEALSGIIDPSTSYMRVVEAELALEAMGRVSALCPVCHRMTDTVDGVFDSHNPISGYGPTSCVASGESIETARELASAIADGHRF